jgi:hypothetical protein
MLVTHLSIPYQFNAVLLPSPIQVLAQSPKVRPSTLLPIQDQDLVSPHLQRVQLLVQSPLLLPIPLLLLQQHTIISKIVMAQDLVMLCVWEVLLHLYVASV